MALVSERVVIPPPLVDKSRVKRGVVVKQPQKKPRPVKKRKSAPKKAPSLPKAGHRTYRRLPWQ